MLLLFIGIFCATVHVLTFIHRMTVMLNCDKEDGALHIYIK